MKSRSKEKAREESERRARRQIAARSKVRSRCYFCEKEMEPDYRREDMLIRFLTKRGKIRPRTRSGLCSTHQRAIARQIKRGRNLGLLPFRIIA
ncbi:MAG: 30S ribosomal protein S18 [candidate division WWE3 bacterium]|nr:30S ribosomal protein S18 [candidate division WWE3 bacterium]